MTTRLSRTCRTAYRSGVASWATPAYAGSIFEEPRTTIIASGDVMRSGREGKGRVGESDTRRTRCGVESDEATSGLGHGATKKKVGAGPRVRPGATDGGGGEGKGGTEGDRGGAPERRLQHVVGGAAARVPRAVRRRVLQGGPRRAPPRRPRARSRMRSTPEPALARLPERGRRRRRSMASSDVPTATRSNTRFVASSSCSLAMPRSRVGRPEGLARHPRTREEPGRRVAVAPNRTPPRAAPDGDGRAVEDQADLRLIGRRARRARRGTPSLLLP